MNKILFFLLVLFNLVAIKAQDYPEDIYPGDSIVASHYQNMRIADSILKAKPQTENTVYPKKFKDNLSSRYVGNDFDYSTSKPRESFWEKIQRKIQEFIISFFGVNNLNKSSQIVEVIIRLFAIILVGFLLYFIAKYLINKKGNLFFGKKNQKIEINDEELQENIHEINFPQSISKFENERDYRSAIRYQFLFVLKKLSDKKLIIWNPEKTNKDYVLELNSNHLKPEFHQLSYIFDYVWYGEFIIDENSYRKFKTHFQNFKA